MSAPTSHDPQHTPVPREIAGPPVRGETGIGGLIPFGLGQGGPGVLEGLGVVWQNRGELGYAWRILRHGVCDGCSLGPRGLQDDTLAGLHVCMRRLQGLEDHTRGPLTPADVADITRLRSMTDGQLRALGRLPFPFVHRRGDRGFRRITWEEALQIAGSALREAPPQRTAWVAAGEGLSNESYYALGKAARLMGTNNVDSCVPPQRAAALSGLQLTLGWRASTCSLSDWIGTDLLLVWGSDLVNLQPVSARYLARAKQQGTRVVVIAPALEPGLAASWIPSDPISAVFGARLTDDFVQVRAGGEVALIRAVLKRLITWGATDRAFVAEHTAGWPELAADLEKHELRELAEGAGVTLGQVEWLAQLVARSGNMVSVWSPCSTPGQLGAETGASIAHLHLARGAVGRRFNGVMPISGLQGGDDCGIGPHELPGPVRLDARTADRFAAMWGHPVSTEPGLDLSGMADAARAGGLDVLYAMGGSLYAMSPDGGSVRAAFGELGLRIHQGTHLDASMLIETAGAVLLLPTQSPYEQRGGGTFTSTERRIRFSPEIPGHPVVGESRAPWEIPGLVACAARPELEAALRFRSSQAVRDEIGQVMPVYAGIERLTREGDWLQWGGPQLGVSGHFTNLPGGRAQFVSR